MTNRPARLAVFAASLVLLSGLASTANADPFLFPGIVTSLLNHPQAVVIEVLNGDGVDDIAIVLRVSDRVDIRLGNGDGTFEIKPTPSTGSRPTSLAIGDLNGDGAPDLVVTNYGSSNSPGNSLSVLLGNGDGTFQPRLNYVTDTGPYAAAIGDFNGDGIPDLVTANYGYSNAPGKSVSVLLGNGDGTFQNTRNFATGDGPWSVATGDLNGDGASDVVTANRDSNSVSVLLSNSDGTFQMSSQFETGESPESVAVSDLDGNGIPDIVSANTNANSFSVLFGIGDGSFHAK